MSFDSFLQPIPDTRPVFKGYIYADLSDVYGLNPEDNLKRWLDARDPKQDEPTYWDSKRLTALRAEASKDYSRVLWDWGIIDNVARQAAEVLYSALQFQGYGSLDRLSRLDERMLLNPLHEAAHAFDLGVLHSLSMHGIDAAITDETYCHGSSPLSWTTGLAEIRAYRIESAILEALGDEHDSLDGIHASRIQRLAKELLEREREDIGWRGCNSDNPEEQTPEEYEEEFSWFFDDGQRHQGLLDYYNYVRKDPEMGRRSRALAETILRLPDPNGVSAWSIMNPADG